MTLDPTARKANVKDSLKKFFVDNLETTSNIPVLFDKGITTPDIVGDKSITRWVSINFGRFTRDFLSEIVVRIFCCTRQDPEGFRLAQTTDILIGYLTDETMTDSMARITLYRSYQDQDWTEIGTMVVTDIDEGEEFESDEGTKAVELLVRIKWGAKI